MSHPVFLGKVEQGTLLLDDGGRLVCLAAPEVQLQIDRLEGKTVQVSISVHRRQRSLSQNAYLHGVVIPLLAEHCGYELDEMKDALKWRFLRIHDDSAMPTVRRTRDLNTAEMAEFVSQCQRLGAELGVYIPDPGESAA